MKIHIFFVYPDSPVGETINWFQILKSGNSDSCHVGFIIDGEVYECLFFGGIVKRDFTIAYAYKKIAVFEVLLTALTELSGRVMCEELEQQIGTLTGIYGFLKLPLQATDAVLSFIARRPIFFATRLSSSKFFICVGLVTYYLYTFGTPALKPFLKNWKGMTVDDFKDFVLAHPEFFKLIYDC